MSRCWGRALVCIALAACGGGGGSGTSDIKITITAAPTSISDQGETSQITVAVTEKGLPATGYVAVSSTAGTLDGKTSGVLTTLTSGQLVVMFACDVRVDSRCHGAITIEADAKGASQTLAVTVGGTPAGDGGMGDGGIVPDSAIVDAGPADARPSDAGMLNLTMAASKNPIFANVGDTTDITATLKTPAGLPRAGETIDFTATAGGFTAIAGGSPVSPFSATTSAAGVAVVRYHQAGAGSVTITGSHAPSGSSTDLPLTVTNVQQISWVSTKCGGASCTIMGIKGSGFNEVAQVTFKAVDAFNNPAPGVNVVFSVTNPPGGTTVATMGTTDALGMVTTNVASGLQIGVFTVKAVVLAGSVETFSPTIGIRGAKAANEGFQLQCSPVNVGAYVSPAPPRIVSIPCTVVLVDRYNNPVGTGTSVNFKTEAGSVPNAIATTPYDSTGANPNEGRGNFVFSTAGTFPAVDVPPLAADPTQRPFPRLAEPSNLAGSLVRNPRDGLVTVMAYLRGEEKFFDDNNNGVRDPGERFIDQGEAFVDANDNGTWDPGEVFIDDAPANGRWDGPNGSWDSDTTIWTEAHILYTDRPLGAPTFSYGVPSPFATLCPGGIPRTVTQSWFDVFTDQNYNVPQADMTAFSFTHPTTNTGSITLLNTTLLDGYGFGIERRLLDAAGGGDCTAGTPICQWKTLFYDWQRPIVGIRYENTRTDALGCFNDNVSVIATVLGVGTMQTTSGGVQ